MIVKYRKRYCFNLTLVAGPLESPAMAIFRAAYIIMQHENNIYYL